MCVCVSACVRACVRLCACVRACVCVCDLMCSRIGTRRRAEKIDVDMKWNEKQGAKRQLGTQRNEENSRLKETNKNILERRNVSHENPV